MEDGVIDSLPRDELAKITKEYRDHILVFLEMLDKSRKKRYGSSSERSKDTQKNAPTQSNHAPEGKPKSQKQLTERYPEAPVEKKDIDFETPPTCQGCGSTMKDSGMTENGEYLEVSEREFFIVQTQRHKHRCTSCHGSIATAPLPPKVVPGGSYGDRLLVDATLSKYCDLIPMERYSAMASRGGFPGLPPHSLIQGSIKLAQFLVKAYELVRDEVLSARVLSADETPHRMLEGDAKAGWYLWGFFAPGACLYECHNTRSADVSSEVLKQSSCEVLCSDAYAGYSRSVATANEIRATQGRDPIRMSYCNAHARRQFSPGEEDLPKDARFMVRQYRRIYQLEAAVLGHPPSVVLEQRAKMRRIFSRMRLVARMRVGQYSTRSALGKAFAYFLKYYDNLTYFLSDADVPIDNNHSERGLRSHVIGRKTWYGTHSRMGAWAASVHFTLVESCKVNGVNPRQYYLDTIQRIHSGLPPISPRMYGSQRSEPRQARSHSPPPHPAP